MTNDQYMAFLDRIRLDAGTQRALIESSWRGVPSPSAWNVVERIHELGLEHNATAEIVRAIALSMKGER